MNRFFVVLLLFAAFYCCETRAQPRDPGRPSVLQRDEEGWFIWRYAWSGSPTQGSGWYKERVLPSKPIDPSAKSNHSEAGIVVPSTAPVSVAPKTHSSESDAMEYADGEHPGSVVTPMSEYQFGRAGAGAAATAFAYGVLNHLVTGSSQAKIEALEKQIAELNNALQAQQAQIRDDQVIIAREIAKRGEAIDASVNAVVSAPGIALEQILPSSGGVTLFSTHDVDLALRLNYTLEDINYGYASGRLPQTVRDTGLASIRMADVASANNNSKEAEGWYKIARTVADFAVGLDPITGTIRSIYELATGANIITGEELTDFERALSVVNLALIGNFGLLDKALHEIGVLSRVVGGKVSASINKSINVLVERLPATVVDRLLESGSKGVAVAEEGFYRVEKSRALTVTYPGDGVFARVMPREHAEALRSGGSLAKPGDAEAYITAAEDLRGIAGKEEIAKKLSLYKDVEGTVLRDLDGHVIVEFKLSGNPNNRILRDNFGQKGVEGYGWIPGLNTSGGARQWLLDSEAVSKNLIDTRTIRIREIGL